jgi:hypothetical protein
MPVPIASAAWVAGSARHYVELARSYLEDGIGRVDPEARPR